MCVGIGFDGKAPVIVSADASPYGVGAVLSIVTNEGERPVAFASRSLSKAEKNYSQLDREGLALVFGVKKFHSFLYGRPFILETDHKPLLGILGKNKPLPDAAPPRMVRWKVTLDGYQYDLVYTPGKQQANSDALSRLPIPDKPGVTPPCADVVKLLEVVDSSLVKVDAIQSWTRKDPTLSAVVHHTQQGWPSSTNLDPELQTYRSKEAELSVHDGCLLWGCRVIIPPQGRQNVLQLLHDGHPGMCAMKRLARERVWWPGIDADIEETVKVCNTCQQLQPNMPKVPISPRKYPDGPWHRIHMDYAGPIDGKMLLVIVDSFSKWPDVWITSSVSAQDTIDSVRLTFATHGLPKVVVTDNAGCFAGEEFAIFMKAHRIKHLFSPPRHPSSNGQAESMVKQVKIGLKKQRTAPLIVRLTRWLFKYRSTPHSTTGRTPCEMLFNRKLRTHLDLLNPRDRSSNSSAPDDRTYRHHRSFRANDPVYITAVVGSKYKWLPATVISSSSQMCRVRLQDGREFTRHLDHIRQRFDFEDEIGSESQTSGRGHHDYSPENMHSHATASSAAAPADLQQDDSLPPESAVQCDNQSSEDTSNHGSNGSETDPIQEANSTDGSFHSTPQRDGSFTTRSGRISRPPDRLSI